MRTTAPSSPSRFPTRAAARTGLLDVSVVIVNYNVREFLEQTLRSVYRAVGGLRVEVFVVDNNSVDGSVEMVREQFPDVRLIANDYNAGFAVANNQAIRKASGRYLLILNPDTILEEDALRSLVRFMDERPEAGAAGCTILNPDGSFARESRRAFPTPAVAFYRIAGLSRLFPKSPTFARYNLTFLPEDEVAEVDALSGSCMLVRRAALALSREEARILEERGLVPDRAGEDASLSGGAGAGLLDEDFFMYGEDLDWCYRIQAAGWKIFYTPETRIIHYKGESTKKGELRYVWLFYGAMSRFTRKHFHSRYSRIFAALLHLGILARAAGTVASNAARQLRAPLIDAVLAFAAVFTVGLIRSVEHSSELYPHVIGTVALSYGLAVVGGVAAAGGYHARRFRLRPVLAGALVGLVAVSFLSFFVKSIAFSRIVILAGCPLIALLLGGLRRARSARSRNPRRAILVGPRPEAERLVGLLDGHPAPAFELIGYVDRGRKRNRPVQKDGLRLGSFNHLRDLVRLRRVDDVIFAAMGLPNAAMFSLMQELKGLPVQFKILAEGSRHVIGKASVEQLAFPSLMEAEQAFAGFQSPAFRRTVEVTLALAGILLLPLISLAARSGHPGAPRLAERLRRMPDVLAGHVALVGYHDHEKPIVPDGSGLRRGVFAVTESLSVSASGTQEAEKAYIFYAANQSVSFDLDILIQSVRNLMR